MTAALIIMYPKIRAAYVGIIGDFLTHKKIVPAATNTENTVPNYSSFLKLYKP